MWWVGYIARVGGERCIQAFVEETEGDRLEDPCRWEDNIDLQEVGWGTWTGLIWLRIGTGRGHL